MNVHRPRSNLIIPMAGYGERFKKAGYDTYKPFIEVLGKAMIDHVLDAFPASMPKYVIVNPDLITEDQRDYLERKGTVTIIDIEPHKNGPAYSILAAKNKLPLDESFFISYADHLWTWDFNALTPILDADGIVFTKRGFHPHLIKDNFSAFCRPSALDPYRLECIKEKGSFTDDWMREPHSIGVYYFKNGRNMISAFEEDFAADNRVAGEFYPSQPFNSLVEQGKDVRLSDVDFYVHVGVPEQLEDLHSWARIMREVENDSEHDRFTNVCCMGGLGARMREVSDTPKALLDMDGKPMYAFVLERFGCDTNTILTVHPIAKRLEGAPFPIVDLGEQTRTQIETLTRAQDFLSTVRQFYLTSCDCYGLFNHEAFATFIERERPDAIIFTFAPSLTQRKLTGQHTHVSSREGHITAVHIKSKSSEEDRGLAGFFWFADGNEFGGLSGVPLDEKNETCVDHFLKYLVAQGKKVMEYRLDQYIHIGTVDEYKEFQYWLRQASNLHQR